MIPTVSRRFRDLLFCAGAAAVVGALAAGVLLGAGFVHTELELLRALHANGPGAATPLALDLTDLGGTQGALAVTVVVALVLLALRQWHATLAVVVSVAATQLVVDLVKTLVARARPPADAAHVEAAGHAFPSAHAATSMALYGLLALVAIAHLGGRARLWACAAAVVLVAGVGATRVYLGAHYPTDVLAGWLVGAVIALATWRGAQALRGLTAPPQPA